VPAHTHRTHVQKAGPREQRGLTLCTLASKLQKQKARSNPYMVIFNFTGYFTLVLRDFPLLVLCDLFHVQISQVLSLCYAIPTSLLLSQDSGIDCFLLILPPATLGATGKAPSPTEEVRAASRCHTKLEWQVER
jgi:hypothetical protein